MPRDMQVMNRYLFACTAIALSAALCACGGGGAPGLVLPSYSTPTPSPLPSSAPTAAPTATPSPVPAPSAEQFMGFWQTWSDSTAGTPYESLGSIPASVTQVGVAFARVGYVNAILPTWNQLPLGPGIATVHAAGGKVLLSIGGACTANAINFDITSTSMFITNLQAYLQSNPGYDGIDFDDECMPYVAGHNQQLIDAIIATHRQFPSLILTMDAFVDGIGSVSPSGHAGEDIAVLQRAGWALTQVNVMAYDAYGWQPDGACTWGPPAAGDNCYKTLMTQYAALMPANKLMLGLCIPSCDDHVAVSSGDASAYATWAKGQGYLGVAIWDVNQDPGGTYINAISSALGT